MSRLAVCAPLRLEARAVRRGLDGDGVVLRTGFGARRSRAQAEKLRGDDAGLVAVTGTCGALAPGLEPGDLIVATEVTGPGISFRCPSAPLVAGELRRAGLRVHEGQIATVAGLFDAGERDRATVRGAIAVDMESSYLLAGAVGRPAIVVRAVSDTPQRSLLRPATVTGGLAALRSLRLAGPVLARWAAAAGSRQVLLAGPRSFCAGVERAIEIVERALDGTGTGAPVYVRKQIVHNTHVVSSLEQRGAIFVDELSEVPDGATVVFSAHGVSPAVRSEAGRRSLQTVDATCPLVAKVHAEARRFASDGYLVVLIGHAGHEEVDGTLGEAPEAMTLVQTVEDVARLQPADPAKVAYVMQTTLAADEAGVIVGALLERFPAARGPGSDDICYATTNRQLSVRAIAAESDVVLVAGSANSSNSRRLVETAQRAGTPAYLIDGTGDIELDWLTGASTVGITAGASAPPAVVSQIVAALSGLGPVDVSERVLATESIRFGLPKEVRQA
ncbi:MAG TPA: 4-hydroxy-3-methylbut-2-enyl diphosphate reductase [Streptosporangiaceae bacterium]|nr:4-hydroxy-3-methylbut-2-enyl diphosphate reductase [Streptosporangiaceae bacterium]